MTASAVATAVRMFHLSGPPNNKGRAQMLKNAKTKMVIRILARPLNQQRRQIPKTPKPKTIASSSRHFGSFMTWLTRTYQPADAEDECENTRGSRYDARRKSPADSCVFQDGKLGRIVCIIHGVTTEGASNFVPSEKTTTLGIKLNFNLLMSTLRSLASFVSNWLYLRVPVHVTDFPAGIPPS